MNMKEEILERFKRYTAIDTTSERYSKNHPSTAGQRELLILLKNELEELKCEDVQLDKWGYLTATLPATAGCEGEPVIGFIAHVDTSPDMCGKDVQLQVVENYDPNTPVKLGETDHYLSVSEFPELSLFTGHTLLTTNGETLLGADDKAGIAEIVTAIEYLQQHSEIPHGKIRVGFTPDEEVGAGVDYFDVEAFGAQYAFTVDSGGEGCLEYENFNAAHVTLRAKGRNLHPGYAKDKMINAVGILTDLHAELPSGARPECTSGTEGYYHLLEMKGGVESASSDYLIRDHSLDKFNEKKIILTTLAQKYGVEIEITDEYYNMREMIEPHYHIIDRAVEAMRRVDVVPYVHPIRGGTDGARLSFMGLPCPNLFTGGMNPHSRFEYASLESMEKAVRTIVEIARADYNAATPAK